MTTKIILMLAGLMVSALALAEATSLPSAATQTQNPHLSRDAKIRLCKAEADQKQLSGDQRNVFIASCMQSK